MNYKGKIVSGDLQENTLTIEMDKPIILKAGEYVVIPIEEFKQQIIDADVNGSIRTAKAIDYRITQLRIKELAEQYYNETYNK